MASGEAQLADMLVKSNSTEIIVLESCLYALILSALLFGNLINYSVSPCFEPSNENSSKHVCGIARYNRLESGNFCKHFIVLFGNNFPLVFWRRNVPVPGFYIGNFGIGLDSHNGIDGGE